LVNFRAHYKIVGLYFLWQLQELCILVCPIHVGLWKYKNLTFIIWANKMMMIWWWWWCSVENTYLKNIYKSMYTAISGMGGTCDRPRIFSHMLWSKGFLSNEFRRHISLLMKSRQLLHIRFCMCFQECVFLRKVFLSTVDKVTRCHHCNSENFKTQ